MAPLIDSIEDIKSITEISDRSIVAAFNIFLSGLKSYIIPGLVRRGKILPNSKLSLDGQKYIAKRIWDIHDGDPVLDMLPMASRSKIFNLRKNIITNASAGNHSQQVILLFENCFYELIATCEVLINVCLLEDKRLKLFTLENMSPVTPVMLQKLCSLSGDPHSVSASVWIKDVSNYSHRFSGAPAPGRDPESKLCDH